MSLTRTTDTIAPIDVDVDALDEALRAGEVPIAVYGLGKVGLPMAAHFAEITSNVIGVDIDPAVVSTVRDGGVPFDHEPGLAPLVADLVETGSLDVTPDGAAAADTARLHIVIVPVTLRHQDRPGEAGERGPDTRPRLTTPTVDLDALESAVEAVGGGIAPGDLVIVETTVPPGTTRTVVLPLLERTSSLDRSMFGLAFSPERVASGQVLSDLRGAYPKVVGGVDATSTAAAVGVYRTLTDAEVISVSDARTAEAVKLFEGVYRDVNIALANELGRVTDELAVDVREVIIAANTQPYCDIHDPGAGVGGHCIPIYPHLLLTALRSDAPLITTARAVNESMPGFIVETVVEQLGEEGIEIDGATIGVLGLTYRPGIPETRNSPAGPIIEGLQARGASVIGFDPALSASTVLGARCMPLDRLPQLDPDAAVIVCGHDAFRTYDWSALDELVVIDARDVLEEGPHPTYTVGRGRI